MRNGFDYGVPFLESIRSILPICDEMVIAVGDSSDGTREAILNLNDSRVKVIDTVWDMDLRKGGQVFARQANIAHDATSGSWAFHLQADEVIHEDGLPLIKQAIEREHNSSEVDGFILPFLHFWSDYQHVRNSRRVHPYEVRIFKNSKLVRSYRDSQGFRKYRSAEGYATGADKGVKLRVKKIDTPIYHYNGVRLPERMRTKIDSMAFHYGFDSTGSSDAPDAIFHYVDRVEKFLGRHPATMNELLAAYPYIFNHDRSKAYWKFKDRLLQPIEDVLGVRFGEYRNYNLLK